MGKSKDQKIELQNAFSRMNFLYQAAIIASKTVPDSTLGNYYGRLMKEVSKKVVEKIHPDMKRALCSCCSSPLFTNRHHASVKVKPHKKKRRKVRNASNGTYENVIKSTKESTSSSRGTNKWDCATLQKNKRDRKPNKLLWSCNRCGFSKTFLQRTSHVLWIDECDNDKTL